MKPLPICLLSATLVASTLPLLAAPNTVWNTTTSPALPLRYIESPPVLRLTPQIANAETYAPDTLFLKLYSSISTNTPPDAATIEPSIASKTGISGPFLPRGILSSSYVQELAYVDAYSSVRKHEEFFTFPSIRMSLAMPRYGNGFGGGYRPLQIGFGPAAFRLW